MKARCLFDPERFGASSHSAAKCPGFPHLKQTGLGPTFIGELPLVLLGFKNPSLEALVLNQRDEVVEVVLDRCLFLVDRFVLSLICHPYLFSTRFLCSSICLFLSLVVVVRNLLEPRKGRILSQYELVLRHLELAYM